MKAAKRKTQSGRNSSYDTSVVRQPEGIIENWGDD